MLDVTPGQWTGAAAAAMYKRSGAALRAHYPGRTRFTILEDNDPSGYKSSKGKSEAALPELERMPVLSEQVLSVRKRASAVHTLSSDVCL